jgi:hypothetical protein
MTANAVRESNNSRTSTSSTDSNRAVELDVWRRNKIKRLEFRVEHLERYTGKLEALLGLACRAAVRGRNVSPEMLLDTLEQVYDQGTRQRREIPETEFLELLRTPPATANLKGVGA